MFAYPATARNKQLCVCAHKLVHVLRSLVFVLMSSLSHTYTTVNKMTNFIFNTGGLAAATAIQPQGQ